MPDASSFHTTGPRCVATAEVQKLTARLCQATKAAESYFDEKSSNYVADEEDRANKATPFWNEAKRLALELAALKPLTPQGMVLRAKVCRDIYTEAMPPEELVDAIIGDLADLPIRPFGSEKADIYASQYTPQQQEEILQFCRSVNVIAEVSCVIALQWMPQIFTYLPSTETDVAKDAAASIGHVSEYLKDLTAARITLRKAGVLNVV